MITGITFSTFDLLHAGHILMLKECKANCDYLIVGLQTDPTIDRAEKNKPVQTLYERYVQLEGCKYVDKIIPYSTEEELCDILKTTKVDVRFIGEEYICCQFTGKELSPRHHYNSRNHHYSTTELRNRIKERKND